MPDERKITIDLKIFDDEGNVVDGTTMDLSRASISDIVDHAAQLCLARRSDDDIDLTAILDELDEALTAAGVLDEVPDAHPRI